MTTMCIFLYSVNIGNYKTWHACHIDPSREVSSHCMTVQVVTSGYKWFYVVKSGVMWFYVVKLFYVVKWFYVAKWLYVAKWFYVVKWFYVAKSDEKWLKVVISCG